MSHWEYSVIRLGHDDLDQLARHLNAIGREGWEIVAAVGDDRDDQIYLKRALR